MNTHGQDHTPDSPEEARPLIADCCSVHDGNPTRVKHYGRDLVCEVHYLERRTEFAKEEEVARALAPLLEHRYKYDPEELIRIVREFITLREDIVIDMLRGATWNDILREDERKSGVAGPSWIDDAATS